MCQRWLASVQRAHRTCSLQRWHIYADVERTMHSSYDVERTMHSHMTPFMYLAACDKAEPMLGVSTISNLAY